MSSRHGLGVRGLRLMLAAALLVTTFLSGALSAAAAGEPGAAYTITNAAGENAVMVFARGADGSLTAQASVGTGGIGTGSNLGSQGAIVLSDNNRWLFAVNAGSNDISSFEVLPDGLRLVGRFPSGGILPISVTVHGNLLYALNAGGSGNIAGFWVNNGVFTPIAGSVQPLSNGGMGAAPGPAQIQFSAKGTMLVVTEKATSLIDTYVVGGDGVAGPPTVHASAGAVPFGFDIDRQDHVVVSEAAGGAGGTGASSYALSDSGGLATVSAAVPNYQGAACWLVISKNGRFAYTANATTNNLSGYTIRADGSLTLMSGAVATGMTPLDLAVSNNGSYLYVLDGGSNEVMGFRIEANGSLTPLDFTAAIAPTAIGLAVR